MTEQPTTVTEKVFGRECPICHERFGSTEFRVHMDKEMDEFNLAKLEAEVMA